MQQASGNSYEVAIIGGGLAGLTASIHLARLGHAVAVLEQKDFPRHKVCGEYISNEVLPVLNSFGIDPFAEGATRIQRFQLSASSGKTTSAILSLGAFGLSRFRLDDLLAQKAREAGVHIYTRCKVNAVDLSGEDFQIDTADQHFKARFVIGAFGKTSNFSSLPKNRQHRNSEKYIAVKRHVRLDFPKDLVALHNFKGGYCGVSCVEENRVNVCYLAMASDLRRSGSIAQLERDVLWKNPRLADVFSESEELFERPVTISNFTFGAKKAVSEHVLMAGDSAGMISPLCGNGMAMAIHSGYRLATLIHESIPRKLSRHQLEQLYSHEWNARFNSRLWWGNRLQSMMAVPAVSNAAVEVLSLLPAITPYIISKTHGEPTLV